MERRLLIIERKAERDQVIGIVTSEGGRIIHDSGGRIMVVEMAEEEKLRANVAHKARIVPIDETAVLHLQDLNISESLFLAALNVRNSPKYRMAKRLRKPPGQEPAEQAALSAPCTEVD